MIINPFNFEISVRLTEFPRGSPSRLERASTAYSLAIVSRGQFRAGLKTHLFTQAYTDTSENFCRRVYSLHYITLQGAEVD